MASQLRFSEELLDYVGSVSRREDDVLRELREESAKLPGGQTFPVSPEEGQLLSLLVAATGASSVLEIGTYTGYSTLCLARGLPPGGQVVTCDITGRWPAIGRPYWERAGVGDRIEVRVGPATGVLAGLLDDPAFGPGGFDLVFVDADKAGYRDYYERSLPLVRPGGLLVIDNTLLFGRVVDPAADDPDTVAIRELNKALHTDERVDLAMLPMADGITLVRKRTA
ncbi:class I SAM-dependent methyltransferase [Pseudosporangium ferrugineum]|uniref:O-methyltransferase n=1 Tax=Pseudosporangium ferrugineum TaxID=439699 RepID=A0A2T0SBH8_9ACTN|nr:class I SAM-dependent methyltransferase [Pseudosporangium ferrugineum]PRY30673.1 O-methyltransferase [Pseudosporangium ferrugineum]